MNNQQCVRDGETSENTFCKTQNVKKIHFEYGFGNDEKYKEIQDKGSEEPQQIGLVANSVEEGPLDGEARK